MKLHSWLTTGTMAILSMAMVSAMAQETPPTDPPQKDEGTDEELIPVKWNEVTFGVSSYDSRLYVNRYATAPSGFTLQNLRLFAPGSDRSPSARLTIRGMFNQDSLIDGYVTLNNGHTVVRGSHKKNSFYNFDWQPKAESEDREADLTIDHSFKPNFGGFFTYSSKRRDGRYPAPREDERTRTRLVGGGIGGAALGGNINLNASETRTYDDSGFQPRTLQRRFDGSYSLDIGDRISLMGTAGYARVEQAGYAASHMRSYMVSGAWDLGPATGLQFQVGQQDYDLNTVENAYVRQRFVTGARLIQRWPDWSLQFGYKHKETERVRADHDFVDVPEVNEYDGRISGKLGPARLTIKGTWEDLRSTAQMQTEDPRQMLWDDRAIFQAKLDRSGETFTTYGTYTYRFQQNKQREIEIKWHNVAFGGSYVFNPTLNAFAEFAADYFNVKGDTEVGPQLDHYFPNSRSLAVGFNWTKDASLDASTSLILSESGDVRSTQLTFSLRKRFSDDHDLELILAPWVNEDRLYNLTDYRTTFLVARYTVRF